MKDMGDTQKKVFGYFRAYEAEQFSFYRIPKVLFTDAYFKELSTEAKVLYGLMLDRMALSERNQWFDESGRVYIIFTVEEVMSCMNCGRDKSVKILSELDARKGIGLIERIRRGLGQPDIVYVKNFIRTEAAGRNAAFLEVGKTDPNNTDKSETENNKTENSKTDRNEIDSIYPSDVAQVKKSNDIINIEQIDNTEQMDEKDQMKQFEFYTELVKQNISYDILRHDCKKGEEQLLDEIVAIVAEFLSMPRETALIGGVKYPYQYVRNRFLLLDDSHIRYVLECFQKNTTEVRNIKAYLLSSMLNATNTIDLYYQAKAQHDLHADGMT